MLIQQADCFYSSDDFILHDPLSFTAQPAFMWDPLKQCNLSPLTESHTGVSETRSRGLRISKRAQKNVRGRTCWDYQSNFSVRGVGIKALV